MGSKTNHNTADFYTAGGGISGFQNGLAIAGDYMSAASFFGISALVFSSGLMVCLFIWFHGRLADCSIPCC